MDCYFRQSWVDKRLSFEGYKGALALSIEMLRKIWKPDTYGDFPNTADWQLTLNICGSVQREEVISPHDHNAQQIRQVR